jgi:isopenicillin-N epimerase
LVDFVEWQGTKDFSSFLAVPDAIQFYQEHDWDSVRAASHRLLRETILELSTYFDLPTFSELTTDWISQMGCAPIPAEVDCAELHKRLYDDHCIEIPVGNWNGSKRVRISIQGYNSAADAQALVHALKTLTDHGR